MLPCQQQGGSIGVKDACIGDEGNANGLCGIDDSFMLLFALSQLVARNEKELCNTLEGCCQCFWPLIVGFSDLYTFIGSILRLRRGANSGDYAFTSCSFQQLVND